ncbi:MAG: hypothetical protein V4616_10185 [Bacteroidota bacterium]
MKKSHFLFGIIASGLLTLWSCKKEEVNTTPVPIKTGIQTHEANLNQLRQSNISVDQLSAKLTLLGESPLNTTILEIEEALNRTFARLPQSANDLQQEVMTFRLKVSNDLLVSGISKTNWLIDQAAAVTQMVTRLGAVRSIMAIDVVDNGYKRIDATTVEITTTVYSVSSSAALKNLCEFKTQMSWIEAASALTTRYNTCPLRYIAFGEYYSEVRTKEFNQYQGFDKYWYEEDYLFSNWFIPQSQSQPASKWNYYFNRLTALVEREKVESYANENYVLVQYDLLTGPGPSLYLHKATIICGRKAKIGVGS